MIGSHLPRRRPSIARHSRFNQFNKLCNGDGMTALASTDRPPKAPLAESLKRELEAILGPDGVLTSDADLRAYDCDAYAPEKRYPDAVALPTETQQVAKIVKLCNR